MLEAERVFNCGGLRFDPNKRISEAEPALERCGADISQVSLVWISDDGNAVVLTGGKYGIKTVTREKRKKQDVANTLQEQNSTDLITQEEFEHLSTILKLSRKYAIDGENKTLFQNPLAIPGVGGSDRHSMKAFIERGYTRIQAKGLACHKGRPYMDISMALKDGDVDSRETIDHLEKKGEIYVIPINELISGLDSAMKRSVTVKDAVVFSGVMMNEEFTWRMVKDGGIYVPNTFMSFTHSARTAQFFSESGMCMKMILPAQSHAVEFGDHEKASKISGNQRQSEVLVDRKYGYRKTGKYEVHGEYVYPLLELVEFDSQKEFDDARERSKELEGRWEEAKFVFGKIECLFNYLDSIGLTRK